MIMMLLGIGGCTALVVAGFGINDSVAGLADDQYSRIETYDMTVAFSEKIDTDTRKNFEAEFDDDLKSVAVLQQTSVNGEGAKAKKACNLMITSDDNISKAVNFEYEGTGLDYPERGEVMINNKLAAVSYTHLCSRYPHQQEDQKQLR